MVQLMKLRKAKLHTDLKSQESTIEFERITPSIIGNATLTRNNINNPDK